VAVVSTAALICDTGALLDYLVKGAPDHPRFRQAIDRARTRYVPGIRRLATRDVRHFAAVRLRDGSAFELVVHPSDPDQ
jgi:hypothetical protein